MNKQFRSRQSAGLQCNVHRFVLVWGLLLELATFVQAVQPANVPGKQQETSGGPYCGVYCAYAALHSLGRELSFEQLLEPRYVGSYAGSSLRELQNAVEDFGGTACAMSGLTHASLRTTPHPIILHVRRPGLNMPYAHWVLFLGLTGGRARILDPPNALEIWELADLLALWDGVGLVVADEPIHTVTVASGWWLEQGVQFLLLMGVLACLRFGLRRIVSEGRWFLPLLLLSLAASATALVSHSLNEIGFLCNRRAVGLVANRHFKPELVSITTDQVQDLVGTPNVVFLDARLAGDFAAGHVPGAISLPIHAGHVERSRIVEAIDPAAQIVVYCQSVQCHWAEMIASDLVFRGYQNVVLYPGGWSEWKSHERPDARP